MKKMMIMMMALGLSFGAFAAEGKKEFTTLQKAILVGVIAESAQADEMTKKGFKSMVEGQSYGYRTSITEMNCTFNEFAKKHFECTVTFGEDDLNDDDYGWGAIWRSVIYGKWNQNPSKIQIHTIITQLLAG